MGPYRSSISFAREWTPCVAGCGASELVTHSDLPVRNLLAVHHIQATPGGLLWPVVRCVETTTIKASPLVRTANNTYSTALNVRFKPSHRSAPIVIAESLAMESRGAGEFIAAPTAHVRPACHRWRIEQPSCLFGPVLTELRIPRPFSTCIDPVDSKQTGDRAVNKQLSEGVNRWLFSSPQSKIFRRGQRGQHARQLM